ncbi:MAG: filamentous hemagglutinin N-terminal domain-containing protein [Opitutaceae bacterium]|jgi:filamentous hemagglutinin family protein
MKTSLIGGSGRISFPRSALLASLVLALPISTQATLPNTGASNLSVVLGSATYPTIGNGTTGPLTISASTATTVLGWGNFSDGSGPGGSLAAGDTLTFSLPSNTAAILNQVSGGLATTINGTVSSNGKVFILNPAGITLGATSSINAAGFYVSAVPETIAYFSSNGTLQVFTATPPATTTTGVVSVLSGASLATVGGSGTIGLAGETVTVAGLSTPITGNLYLEAQAPASAGTNVTLAGTATATTIGAAGVGGNLTVVTNGGNVNLASAANVTITGAATINTSGGAFNGNVTDTTGFLFSAAAAGTKSTINAGSGVTGGTVTFGNNGGSGSADFASIGIVGGATTLVDSTANTVALGTSSINGALSVTSVGGSINNTGAVAATGNISLTANTAGKSVNFSTSGNVSFGAISSTGAANSVTITGTGNLTFTGAVTSPTVSITTTGGNYSDAGVVASTQETVSASGNVTLAAEAALNPLVSITSTGGSITQSGPINITAGTFTAPTITLTNAANTIGTAILIGGGSNAVTPVQLTDAVANLVVGNGTNVTGAAAIINDGTGGVGTITLGAATNTLTFGSTLALTATGTGVISTLAPNFNVTGAVTATSGGGAVTLGLAGTTNSAFGQIGGNSGAGLFTINSSAAVNLGTLTTTGGLTVTANGNIKNTGNLVVTASGGVTLNAGTAGTPGSIQLGATGGANNAVIPGTITVNTASGLTLWDKPGATVTVATGTNALPSATINVTDGSNLIVDANTSAKPLAALSFAMTGGNGNVTVTDAGSLAISNATNVGTGTTTVTVNGNGSTLTFGSGVALASTGAASFTTTGTSAPITDTAGDPISIAGPVALGATGVSVTSNATSSFGQLTLTSTGSVAVTEGPAMNIGSVTLTGASGSLTLTSVTGSITQGGGAAAITVPAGYTAAFSAPAGNVSLNLAAGNAFNSTVPISLTAGAAGLTTVINNGGVLLGNVQVPLGTFTINTLASGGSISQAAGSSLFEYGAATFTTQAGAITLANSGNNFGNISIDTTNAGAAAAGASASVRETGTNHYTVVKTGTTGNFTALDDASTIIEDSGAGTGLFVGGATSLSTPAGSILLANPLNNFGAGGIKLVTASTIIGNATITDSNALTIISNGTSVGGNLIITNNNANGVIRDGGAASLITVTGNLDLLGQTGGTGFVQFTGGNSTFGGVLITTGSGISYVLDNESMVILGGTDVAGSLALATSANLTTDFTGTYIFGGSLTLTATGKIVMEDRINVANGLTVDSTNGPTDLSILSLAHNLNNIAVTNIGNASNYFGPGP